jgi:transcriptional regulator with XRE-family HTH domain
MDLLSSKILELREEKGMNLIALSELSGIEKELLKAYEKGLKQVTLSHLQKLAQVFNVTADYLLDRPIRSPHK